jgi:hypothetical protein
LFPSLPLNKLLLVLFRFAVIKRSVVKSTRKINAAKTALGISSVVLVVIGINLVYRKLYVI